MFEHETSKTLIYKTCKRFPRTEVRNVPVLMYQSIPKPPIPPRAISGHLTRVKFRTVGNLTQNEARPVGHLTFVSKRLVSGQKQKDFAIL